MSKHTKKSNTVAASSKQAHVLLVDDEQDITGLLRSALQSMRIKATAFNDPAEAMSAFKPGQYDLAIIDIRMPGMNGFELVKNLKSIDKDLKTCFLTAFEIEKQDLIQNNLDGTIECIIKKPVRLSDFVRKVNRLLEG